MELINTRLMFVICSVQLLFHLSESTLKFAEEPSNPTYVVKGGEVRLRWKFVCTEPGGCAKELVSVMWYSRNVIFVHFGILNPVKNILPDVVGSYSPGNFDGEISNAERNRYVGRVSFPESNDSLVISGITEADLKVNYSCALLPDKGEPSYSQVKLEWAVLPGINDSSKPNPQDLELNGNSITLSCEAEGKPAPSIAWVKDGRVVKNTTNETTLVVSEKGTYECRVSNIAGNDSYRVSVVGKGPGSTTPTIASNTTKHRTEEGSDTWIIVVAVVVPLLIICVVIGILLWIVCRKKKGKRTSSAGKQRSTGKSNQKYETIQMDKYETPYPSKRDGQPGQPYEGGYEDVQKDRKNPEVNQYASVDRKTPQGSPSTSTDRKTPQDNQYASLNRKTPKDNQYASVDRKTPQESPKPSDQYAQVDMSKKMKKRKPGELLYADLDLAESGSNGTSPPTERKKPRAEPTMYAEVQFDQRPAQPQHQVEGNEY